MADQQPRPTNEAQSIGTDYFSTLSEVGESYTAEVKAKIGRLDGLIGEAHYLSVGNYKEQIIREQVERITPGKFSVNTGFVLGHRDGKIIRSKQIDILVWDSTNFAPIIQASDFVVIPPEALRAAIEVKGILDHAALDDALDNLESLTPFSKEMIHVDIQASRERFPFVRFLVAGDVKTDPDDKPILRFPDAIWNKLYAYYTIETIEERLRWCGTWHEFAPMMWINGIAVINHGYLATAVHTSDPMFVSYQLLNKANHSSSPPVGDDSIGLLCATLRMALAQPRLYSQGIVTRPFKDPPQLVLPHQPSTAALVTNPYTPREPQKATAEA